MKRIIFFAFVFIISLAIYYPVLTTYFSQDDFFHFKVANKFTNIIDMFGFCSFSERGIAFYRPLFRELLFNSFYSIFGLNHLPFRILQFALLFLNSYLGFYFIKMVFKEVKIAYFTAFFYAICASQVSPLFYLAGGIQVLGATTFLLSSLIFTLKYLESNRAGYLFITFIAFILALCSHELASVLPVLIFALFFVRLSFKNALSQGWKVLPFFIILAAYLYLEITIIGFPAGETQYKAVFSIKSVMNSYMWYTGWALGLPETLIDFVNPGFKLNPSLMRYWGNYYLIIFPAFFVSIFLLIIKIFSFPPGPWANRPRRWEAKVDKKLAFLIFWYLVSLAPVILLPLHKSTQYLEPGLIPFWAIIGYITFSLQPLRLKRRVATTYLVILIGSLFTLSATSIFLQRTTYPAAQRGVIAEKLIKQITGKYPTLPKGAIVYIENDPDYPFVASEWGSSSKQAAFILNNSDALQLVYKDPGLKVYYQDLEGLPKEIEENEIYKIVAKIF